MNGNGAVKCVVSTLLPSHDMPRRICPQEAVLVYTLWQILDCNACRACWMPLIRFWRFKLWRCRFDYVPATPEPVSGEVKALMEEQGVDFETSGLKYLTNDARVGFRVPNPITVTKLKLLLR